MQFGDLLVREKRITAAQLADALESQVVHGGRLGTNLVELGFLTEKDVAEALGRLHGLPAAFGEIQPDAAALGVVPPKIADQKEVVPLRMDGTRLSLGMSNPHDLATQDLVAFRSGKRVIPVVMAEFRIHILLRKYYRAIRPLRAVDLGVRRSVQKGGGKGARGNATSARPVDLQSETDFQSLYGERAAPGMLTEDGAEGADSDALRVEPVAVFQDEGAAPIIVRAPFLNEPPSSPAPQIPTHSDLRASWIASPEGMKQSAQQAARTAALTPPPSTGPRRTDPQFPMARAVPEPPPAAARSAPGTAPQAVAGAEAPASSGPRATVQGGEAARVSGADLAMPAGAGPILPGGALPAFKGAAAPAMRSGPGPTIRGGTIHALQQPGPGGANRASQESGATARPALGVRPGTLPSPPGAGASAQGLGRSAAEGGDTSTAPRSSPTPPAWGPQAPLKEPAKSTTSMAARFEAQLLSDAELIPEAELLTSEYEDPSLEDVLELTLADEDAVEPAYPPMMFAEAQKALAQSLDREAVATTVLRFATSKFKRALILSVTRNVVTGWRGMGEGVSERRMKMLVVPLDVPSSFKLVRDTCSHFIGAVRDAPTETFYRLLGAGPPSTAVMMPILARGRVVHLLYVDSGPNEFTPPDVGELLILSQSVTRSYEALIQQRQRATP